MSRRKVPEAKPKLETEEYTDTDLVNGLLGLLHGLGFDSPDWEAPSPMLTHPELFGGMHCSLPAMVRRIARHYLQLRGLPQPRADAAGEDAYIEVE